MISSPLLQRILHHWCHAGSPDSSIYHLSSSHGAHPHLKARSQNGARHGEWQHKPAFQEFSVQKGRDAKEKKQNEGRERKRRNEGADEQEREREKDGLKSTSGLVLNPNQLPVSFHLQEDEEKQKR